MQWLVLLLGAEEIKNFSDGLIYLAIFIDVNDIKKQDFWVIEEVRATLILEKFKIIGNDWSKIIFIHLCNIHVSIAKVAFLVI